MGRPWRYQGELRAASETRSISLRNGVLVMWRKSRFFLGGRAKHIAELRPQRRTILTALAELGVRMDGAEWVSAGRGSGQVGPAHNSLRSGCCARTYPRFNARNRVEFT